MSTLTTAESVNTLVRFCALRDVPVLTAGLADVAILFGGSVLGGADVFADGMRAGVADRYMVVGGQGHTTDALRSRLRDRMGWADVATMTEAALFARYLAERHGLTVDLLEQESTNCGNNVTYALDLLRNAGVRHDRLLLMQDATMQHRMSAGFRLHAPPSTRIVDYAAHRTTVTGVGGALSYVDPPDGMWQLERYVAMLMGEIPRLTDDEHGYGPAGRGFIAHVDVPDEVRRAFDHLRENTGFATRRADPRWAG
ncbi:hypothetical protein AB0M20_29145 [Actinoplanes sp. NPDC051633]|uniref:hypothetical protein n=1 Tax=Actinoplanes sp. NPDC051633 TaxID=3155670 RepID=UPI00341B3548